ncbi:MAG: hypothetical protein FJY97_00990 [candidate division Zixibacteria bacterium]|nr:hypothetical protein [candidate division Zixibacteria bacterium]
MNRLFILSWFLLVWFADVGFAQDASVDLAGGFTHAPDARRQALTGVRIRFGRLILRPEARYADSRDHGPMVIAGVTVGFAPTMGAARVRPYLFTSIGYAVAPEEGDESPLIGGGLGIGVGGDVTFSQRRAMRDLPHQDTVSTTPVAAVLGLGG